MAIPNLLNDKGEYQIHFVNGKSEHKIVTVYSPELKEVLGKIYDRIDEEFGDSSLPYLVERILPIGFSMGVPKNLIDMRKDK